jgi:hypothetical protein
MLFVGCISELWEVIVNFIEYVIEDHLFRMVSNEVDGRGVHIIKYVTEVQTCRHLQVIGVVVKFRS